MLLNLVRPERLEVVGSPILRALLVRYDAVCGDVVPRDAVLLAPRRDLRIATSLGGDTDDAIGPQGHRAKPQLAKGLEHAAQVPRAEHERGAERAECGLYLREAIVDKKVMRGRRRGMAEEYRIVHVADDQSHSRISRRGGGSARECRLIIYPQIAPQKHDMEG